ncbi:MAG: putative sulfate exporter family transporter [Thermodesulfovibrionia bacterium]
MDSQEKGLYGLIISALVGIAGYGIHVLARSPAAEPLVISLLLGIIIRAILPDIGDLRNGLSLPVKVFIPIGLIFYSAHNLNLTIFMESQPNIIIVLIMVMLSYFISTIITGRLLKQRRQITYLIANGSAICGASAIIITSPAIDAEPDDVSISLLSVTIAAMTGAFIIFPFLATTFSMTDMTYSILSGAVIQITGFIRIAMRNISYTERVVSGWQILPLVFSIKAMKYLGLFLSIPIFTSIMKKRLSIPYVLWIFLVSGIIGTLIFRYNEPFYNDLMPHVISPLHKVSWSIALSAIGLNADINRLLSDSGIKALVMAFVGLSSAIIIFFIASYILL